MSIIKFMELFKGRKDCYGLQQFCMKEPLTKEVYKDHIEGRRRIGVYPIHNGDGTGPGEFCSWIAADIDDNDFNKVISLKMRLETIGIMAYIERSKSKGYHVFAFFDKNIEAYKLRLVFEMVLEQLGFTCELFPKQDRTSEGSYGNFINLPLFGGDIKNEKTIFVDDKNFPLISNIGEITTITINTTYIINNIIEDNNLTRAHNLTDTQKFIEDNKISSKTPACIENIKNKGVKPGQRNKAVFFLSVYYKERNLNKKDIFDLIVNWNQKNSKPLDENEITSVIDSVFKGGYKAFGCEDGILSEYCEKEDCPIINAANIKKRIEEGIIVLVFRDQDVMVFRQKEYEFRLSNFEFSKSGNFRMSFTLSKDKKFVWKDIVNLNMAIHRKRILKLVNDNELEESLIKLNDLVKQQFAKEEKEKLLHPKQLYIMTEQEKEEAIKMLNENNMVLANVIDITNRMGVVGEETLRLMVYLCFTSRILATPLSITVKGEASSGKSFSCQNVMKLIPEEGIHFMTRATAQAFFHMPEDGLQHRIIYINELAGGEQADYSIRSAQSEGDLIIYLPLKDPVTNDMVTTAKRVKGPAGFLITTTKAFMFNENETRNFSVFSDDSPQLTDNIGNITIRKAMGEEFNIDNKEINLWKNMQRLLNPDYRVIIPYAKEVFSSFPNKPVRIRRDRERFRVLIEIITILHQYHREKKKIKEDGTTALISTLADYYIAKLIAGDLLTYTIYEISPAAEDLWREVKIMEEEKADLQNEFTFKYKDLADRLNWKISKVKKWMFALINIGLVDYSDKSGGGKGKSSIFKITSDGVEFSSQSLSFLPSVKDLYSRYVCNKLFFYNPITNKQIDPEEIDAPEGLLENMGCDKKSDDGQN